MLKYMVMLIFMMPLFSIKWKYTQVFLFMFCYFLMMEFGKFVTFESMSLGFGMDFMAFTLVLLSAWICALMLIGMESMIWKNFYEYKFIMVLLSLLLLLIMSFSSLNLFMFYIYFEGSLIPTFLMILGWGFQVERLQASIYLLFYTLISSLPLLMMILFLFYMNKSLTFLVLSPHSKYIELNMYLFIFLYLAFLVKLPMFLVHLWLPKAHVEAPVAGSMILAGILLKLGGYGILRISFFFWKKIVNYIFYLVLVSMIGGVLIGLNCLRQTDMKLLVAYSSVSHMGLMLGGLLTLSVWGMSSSLAMMLSHGLCSSGLFFLVNVAYERVGSRNLLLVKGMLNYLPKMTLWWFLFCAMNMAAPPSLNLVSEIGLINALISWSYYMWVPVMFLGFFAAGYSLYLFSFSQHGKSASNIYSFYSSDSRENLILFLHWGPLNFFVVSSEMFVNWL